MIPSVMSLNTIIMALQMLTHAIFSVQVSIPSKPIISMLSVELSSSVAIAASHLSIRNHLSKSVDWSPSISRRNGILFASVCFLSLIQIADKTIRSPSNHAQFTFDV